MRRISNTPLLKIFTSLFLIIYTFVPPALAVDELNSIDNSQDVLDDGISDPEWIAQEPEQEIILVSADILPKLKNSSREPAPGSIIDTLLTYTPITDPITQPGVCIEDAASKTLNCTANDVSIASVTSVEILDDGCQSPADTVTFEAIWDVSSTSNKRYDIGLYFATAGQTSAHTGACSVSTLPNSPTPPWYNYDSDNCGDINSSSTVHPQITLTVKCADPDGDNTLNVPYCTSWDNNAGGVCNGPSGAIPSTESKCSCNNGFEVPITVPYEANIEVKKNLTPSTDEGGFNLLIDDNSQASCVSNNGTTGKVVVGAGTSVNPGAIHTVGESSTGCSTDIDNYNSTISCVNRGTSTFHGGNPLTIATTGPLSVPVVKDDDIVCTVTNTRKTGHLIVQKTTLPSGDQTEFSITASSSTNGSVLNGTTGSITDSSDHDYQVTTGTYSVNETIPTGWIQTANTCTDVVVGENETKYCEITNTKLPTLTINKILVPTSNSGLFNLKIDDTVYATNIGNNGTTGAQIVGIGTHTFSEEAANSATSLNDYAITYGGDSGCNTDGSIILAAGENKICTITNVALGTLTITKDAVPDSSQDFNFTTTGSGLTNFILDDDSEPTLLNSKTFLHLLPGIYGVSETSITGWDLTNTTCSDQSLVSAISVSAGETVTCTFTNTQRGIISGFKLNDPDGLLETTNGRTGVPGWTIELWKDGNKVAETITSGTGFFSFENLIPGDYQLREVLVNGWIRIYPTDERLYVTLIPGENDTNNNFINVKYPTITIYKNVDENGDGDLNDSVDIIGATDWTWDINENGNYATGSTVSNKMPGTYTISEDQKTNYHVTSLVCGQTNYGAVESQSITLTSGQDLVCTFTNTRDTGTLRVVKILNNDNGGQLHEGDFSFTIDSSSPIYFEADGQNDFTKYAGLSYDITEVSTPGYTTTYSNCNDVVVPKNGIATCTITNDDIAPSLTLIKAVTNNNGGLAKTSDWILTATGPTIISGAGGIVSDNTFKAGTYTLSENTGLSGYAASSWSCTGIQNIDNTITLSLNDTAVCTITNDDIAPTLTIVKTVTNTHGGNKVVSDFPLFINTTQVTSGTPNTVQANVEYTVSETNLPGYSAFNWHGDCSSDGKITLQPGDNKTCTITNYDQPGTLIIKKILIKDNGGNESYTDFTFQVNQGTITPFESDGENQLILDAGTYSITEPHAAGYDTTYDNCNNVVLSNGETETCTITNNDIAPTITLNKVVIKNNGGTAGINDFGLKVGDTAVTSGQTISVPANVAIPLNEAGLEGYSFVSITGDQGCPTSLGGTVTLTEGQHLSCTINNDDNIPHLTLIKRIENRHGGTANPTDWTLTATGPTTISGAGGVVSDSTFSAGTYTLSESTGLSGYTASNWSCTGVENNGNTITLGLDDSATCTITNSDVQAKLTVIKHVENDNGGDATAEDFTMLVTGVNATNSSFAGSETGIVVGLDAGAYSVDESPSFGYSKTLGTECSGTITVGEEKTCIITNDDVAPTLKLTKTVKNDDGGIKTSADWTLYAQGSELSFNDLGNSTTFHAVNAGTTYTLSESVTPSGYASSWWSCTGGEASSNTVKLGVGQNVTCTINNDDIAPTLRLVKNVVNNYGGNAVANDWDLTATGEARGFTDKGDSTTVHTVKAGVEYTLTESNVSGYTTTGLYCTGGSLSENKLTLGLNENVVCTITNSDIAPTITLIKSVDHNHGGNASVNDFGLTIGGTSVTSGQKLSVNSNTPIIINETGLSGYQFISITGDGCPSNLGDTVTLNEGQDLVCTITNDDIQPTLTIVKNVINNTNDRGLSAENFTITVTGTDVSNPSFVGSETGTTVGLDAGTYSVNETYDNTKYSQDLSAGCSGTIALGENKLCTITNTDINNIPTIEAEKTASTPTLPENGGNVTYTFTVKNTGWEAVSITSLTDDKFGTLLGNSDCQVGTILAGLSQCSFDLTKTLSGNARTTHVNEFIASAEDDEGTPVSNNDDETITFTDVLPSISVNKVASTNEIPETGGNVTYTFTVTNNTIEPLIIMSLSDDVIGNHLGDIDCYEGMTLNGNASCTFDETYTIPTGTAPATHTNTFTAIAYDDEGNPTSDNDDEVVTLTYVPTLKLIKNVVNQYESERFSSDWTLYATGETNSFYVTGDEGQYHVVAPNTTYTLSESGPDGFEASEWSCTGGTLIDSSIILAPEDDVTCTITNTGLPGTINIYKDVINNDFVGEDVYADTVFNVNLNGDLTDIKQISDTQSNPQVATYENLNAGQYTINEDSTDGYTFLDCYEEEQLRGDNLSEELPNTFYVANGEALNIICRNRVLDPVLNITKTNNTGSAGMLAGDSVMYTLTVTTPNTEPEEEYLLNNVIVTDILPAGFTYQAGTWTATSSIRGNIKGVVTTEPIYGSNPALWNLGDMVEGETVVLTYVAKISTTQDPGTYKDIAWTQGTSLTGGKILGNINMGIFVGTEVKVIAPVEEGDVLGITDYVTLPNTGADTLLTIGALASVILGLLVLILNPKKTLKLLGIAFIACTSLVMFSNPTKAYAQTSNIIVKIEQPVSQINTPNFKIGYVALDLLGRSLQIQCYESTHGAFGPIYTTNSGNCVIDNTAVTTDGTYEFYATATAGAETAFSEKVFVTVDLTKPSPVTNYEKTTNGCINTLKFTTANDGGQTSKIQIFRSDKSTFVANSSNLIAEIPTTSGQAITYQDTTPLCNVTYFYAIRALDTAGNISAFVTDKVVVVTILPAETSEQGEVAGEEITAEETSSPSTPSGTTANNPTEETNTNTNPIDTSGEVKGETTQESQSQNIWSWLTYVLIGVGILVIGGTGYIYVKNRKAGKY